jgi:hypothetical protein
MPALRRREFITLLGGAAAWPLAASAQQGEQMRRIGVLNTLAADDAWAQTRYGGISSRPATSGWTIVRKVQAMPIVHHAEISFAFKLRDEFSSRPFDD